MAGGGERGIEEVESGGSGKVWGVEGKGNQLMVANYHSSKHSSTTNGDERDRALSYGWSRARRAFRRRDGREGEWG